MLYDEQNTYHFSNLLFSATVVNSEIECNRSLLYILHLYVVHLGLLQ